MNIFDDYRLKKGYIKQGDKAQPARSQPAQAADIVQEPDEGEGQVTAGATSPGGMATIPGGKKPWEYFAEKATKPWEHFANQRESQGAYLPSDPTDFDPQSAAAAHFLQQSPTVQGMLNEVGETLRKTWTGENLKEYNDMLNAARHGDQNAMNYLTAHSLQMAMGALGNPRILSRPLPAPAPAPVGPSFVDKTLAKTGKIFGSIPEHHSLEYLKQKGNLPSRPETEIVDDLYNKFNASKDSVGNAKDALAHSRYDVKDKSNSLTNKKNDFNNQLNDQKFKAGQDVSSTDRAYSEAAQQHKEGLQSVNARELIAPIQDALNLLKEHVKYGSSNSYDILSRHSGTVSLGPLKQAFQKGMDNLHLNEATLTKTDTQAVQELDYIYQNIMKLPNEVRMPMAKSILQSLDRDTTYLPGAGRFQPIADAVKQKARGALDELVKKKSPDYERQMLIVKRQRDLLEKGSDAFGTPEKAFSKLENIKSAKGKHFDFDLLKQIGEETGHNFRGPINQYINAHDALSRGSVMQKQLKTLPTYKAKEAASAEANRLSDPAIRRQVSQRIKSTKELRDLNEARTGLDKSQQGFKDAKQAHEPYNGFSQGSVQNTVRGAGGIRNFAPNKKLEAVSKATGHNYVEEAKNRAILDSFKKSDTNGSRKTNMAKGLGKTIGAGLGYVAGGGLGELAGIGGHLGAGIGAGIGFTMDKESGAVLKALLDGKIRASAGADELASRFGKYAKPIAQAAQKNERQLIMTLRLLYQNDPQFKSIADESDMN